MDEHRTSSRFGVVRVCAACVPFNIQGRPSRGCGALLMGARFLFLLRSRPHVAIATGRNCQPACRLAQTCQGAAGRGACG
eukprot:scaffold24753_cov108-Isochrysis_galbana.AAC.3